MKGFLDYFHGKTTLTLSNADLALMKGFFDYFQGETTLTFSSADIARGEAVWPSMMLISVKD